MTTGTGFKAAIDIIGAALSVRPLIAPVETDPRRPVPEGVTRAIRLRLAQARANTGTLGTTRWETPIVIECYARGEVDSLLDSVWRRLFIPGSPLSGPGIEGIVPIGIDWDYDEGRTVMTCAALQILVRHRTENHSLTPWS